MTNEEFEKLPRDKRWSYSRLNTFLGCPRKHHYSYIEEIKGQGNIHLELGDYFHRLMEAYNKEEDPEPILEEYERKVTDKPKDLMRRVFTEYINHYEKDNVLYTEVSLFEEWENKDWAMFKIDCIYEKARMNVLRDYKTTTNNLKYNFGSTKYNQQMLLYKAIAEENLGLTIHAIEIDEVRIALLEDVPYNKNGKPTADFRRLGLVTYENYFNALSEMGLEEEDEYQDTLDKLLRRGHPLFNRVIVDIPDNKTVDENLDDMYGAYTLARTGVKSRKRSVLCDYCDMRELCDAEYSTIDEEGRQLIIDKITKK